MAPSLSPRPDLTQIKRQAKELLKAQRAGDSSVCAKLRLIPRLSARTDAEILSAGVSLQEVQHALAKDYGFATWAELKRHVEATGDQVEPARPASRAALLDGVTIRPMVREDLPALRRFDDEVTLTVDEWNAQYPPDKPESSPGGPWADDEELTAHFAKYQRHGGTTLLAEDAGRIVGFADLWPANEPEPFGRSLDVECVDYFREYYLAGLERRLLTEAEKVARAAGLPALDIGTNTCSAEYVSLRSFGLRVFYEYDNVVCHCRPPTEGAAQRTEVTPETADLSGLIKANHWSPTDFTFRAEDEPTHLVELRRPDRRVIAEFWRYVSDERNAPVPPNPPNRCELFVPPEALGSAAMMTDILVECAAVAAELGAEQISLPCPSDLDIAPDKLDVVERSFAYAWLRKRL